MIELTAEGSGETVGEAKWNALRELERQAPALDKAAVRFQVITEGQRGLLGVGYAPARVLASVEEGDAASPRPSRDESPLAARMRTVVEHVTAGMGVRCAIDVREDEETLTVACSGGDLGLLIGKHGQTIDAVQAIANAIAAGEEQRKEIVVDAAGYRDRRRRTLEAMAVRCAEQALREQAPVELEPMTAADRKLVHERLHDYDGIETASDGEEPHRYVVVRPA
jgi:spoIIIJ-associated protein